MLSDLKTSPFELHAFVQRWSRFVCPRTYKVPLLVLLPCVAEVQPYPMECENILDTRPTLHRQPT
jgi:hypothetical protein